MVSPSVCIHVCIYICIYDFYIDIYLCLYIYVIIYCESEVISDDIPDVSDYILVVVKRFSVSRAAG